jgi:hypothetical protein
MTRAASFDHLVVTSSSTMSSYRPSLRPSSSAGVRHPVAADDDKTKTGGKWRAWAKLTEIEG